ncbi:hypothetical protein ACFO0N_00145 [Halobium salinum]|uniref:Tat (Twin-arginine translocation) pathway signal sequence n=1 Tax=Halobium salinum TaxID=1364940 RepID=A0ABD5P6T4_9EURY|nr:hypothetical protein [Halobium salinum]
MEADFPVARRDVLRAAGVAAVGTLVGLAGCIDLDGLLSIPAVTFVNDTYGYSLRYPEAWTVDGADPATVVFASEAVDTSLVVNASAADGSSLAGRVAVARESLVTGGSRLLTDEATSLASGQAAHVLDWESETGEQYAALLTGRDEVSFLLWYVRGSDPSLDDEAVWRTVSRSFAFS